MPVLDRRRREDPRREQTEAAFLEAAGALLAEGLSFAELSVSVVAGRAGRTRTAFYAHFEDRRALLMRLVEPLRTEARRAIAPFTDGEGDVHESITALLGAMRANRHVLRAVVEAATYDAEVDRFWQALLGEFSAANQARLERAGMPVEQAQPTAAVLTWMTERSCTQQLRGEHPSMSDETLLDALADAWRRALG